MEKKIFIFLSFIMLFSFVSSIELNNHGFSQIENYNFNFYYAVGAAIFGVLIVLFFAYALLKKPKNKW